MVRLPLCPSSLSPPSPSLHPHSQRALKPPGFIPDWHLAVRMTSTKQLVGFITGIPVTVFVHGKCVPPAPFLHFLFFPPTFSSLILYLFCVSSFQREHRLCEINFLCVHSTMRSKRLAPILIREITRRVRLSFFCRLPFPSPLPQSRR